MTARDDAIEAGAKAVAEHYAIDGYSPEDAAPFVAAAYDAMAPIIRAGIARELEEMDWDDTLLGKEGWFSAALKARAERTRRKVAEEIAQHAVGTNFDDVHDDEMIRFGKIREAIGGAS